MLAFVAVITFTVQQFSYFLSQRDVLQRLQTEAVELSGQIKDMMYQEASLQQQLKEAQVQHARLRSLLPETLQAKELEQRITTLAEKHRIKILATKTAIHSRPGYSEASIDITLEAGELPAKRFMQDLKSIPRRIHIIPPEKRGKKSIHLAITVYAVGSESAEKFSPPHCIEMPGGLLLSPLRETLERLYADYQQPCSFVTNYSELLHTQMLLQTLQSEISRLAVFEQQLRSRP
jgi:hypothetical protein